MENEELQRGLMTTKATEYRGSIIAYATIIEKYFDMFISDYFCSDHQKRLEFMSLLLGSNRVSFDGKRKLTDTILKNKLPEFYTEFPTFTKSMNTVMQERNAFAHCMSDGSDTAIERFKKDGSIGIMRQGIKPRTDWYNEKKIKEIMESFEDCRNIIRSLAFSRFKGIQSAPDESK